MDEYDHIHYLKHPHFTVSPVDQWGEQGYLLAEGKVFAYEEDRKEQCGSTHTPRTIDEFLKHAERVGISIPDDFMEELKANG